MVRLPVLDEAHHGSGHSHVDGLSHLRQEVLLDLKAPLPNAPAPIHQEGQVHLTICKQRTRRKVAADSIIMCLVIHLFPVKAIMNEILKL